jgi:hypothetical protein
VVDEEVLTGQNAYKDLFADIRGIPKKIFTLPTSGTVALFGPEIGIVDTPEFQRLGGVKQLGTSYVVFRGALHTRFEHSLGSLHQAERMIQKIIANPYSPNPDFPAWRLARLGALLHDLPHVPFGHTLEDEFHLLQRHDKNPDRMRTLLEESPIGEILREQLPDGEYEELLAILRAKDDSELAALRYPFVGDIVGNTVCADLLDYVPRDLEACGMPVAIGDRFMDFLSISSDEEGGGQDHQRIVLNLDKRGMPRPDVESEVIKLLTYRYELAERVYFHHAKNAASVMIARAVQEAGFASDYSAHPDLDENFKRLSDELLLHSLVDTRIEVALGLITHNVGDRDLAARLAKDVTQRRLFKIAYLAVHDDLVDGAGRICEDYGQDPAARKSLEDELAAAAGLEPGEVLVHVPRHHMMTKDAEVRVRTSANEIVTLTQWDKRHGNRVEALNRAHERLWRLTVYIHPERIHRRGLVSAKAEQIFKAPSRYVDTPPVQPYRRAVYEELASKYQLDEDDRSAMIDFAAQEEEGGTLDASEAALLDFLSARRNADGRPELAPRLPHDEG